MNNINNPNNQSSVNVDGGESDLERVDHQPHNQDLKSSQRKFIREVKKSPEKEEEI